MKTEFYETAVQLGFYGLERGGLRGKKDNVRKYWEDTVVKLAVKPEIERMLETRSGLRVVDLGCGSGEGYELLTHLPPSSPVHSSRGHVLRPEHITAYHGVDLSPAMIEQGRKNYSGIPSVGFEVADLNAGFPLRHEEPYDLYFSSYCSLPHLTPERLEALLAEMFQHANPGATVCFDLFGRHSPAWPDRWSAPLPSPHNYTMGYLLDPSEQTLERAEFFQVWFWTGAEARALVAAAAARAGRAVTLVEIRDRSLFIGRHMDTAFFKDQRFTLREQVNRLFDRDHRGQVPELTLDLAYLDSVRAHAPEARARIQAYAAEWNAVVGTLHSLMHGRNAEVARWIETSPPRVAEELKMLAWLLRNAERFPVVDFWASVMGPQVACVLRNLETTLGDGVGCGHSLIVVARVE